jgi:hypothetical protein
VGNPAMSQTHQMAGGQIATLFGVQAQALEIWAFETTSGRHHGLSARNLKHLFVTQIAVDTRNIMLRGCGCGARVRLRRKGHCGARVRSHT